MRPLSLALPLLLLACGSQDAPPGEPIGTFAFVATLDRADPVDPEPDALPRCAFAGAPGRIEFDGSFSHDRETGEAWLLVDGTLRQGTLDGAAFTLGLPQEDDGSIRAVPRRLPACSCDLLLIEVLEGALVRSASAGCDALEPEGPPGPDTCPRIDEDGALSWDTCGGVCGVLREELRFPAGTACACEVDGVEQPAPERCAFTWDLVGTRIGG